MEEKSVVDFLCESLARKLGLLNAITFYIDHQEEIEQAKKIEMQQKMDFAKDYLKWFKSTDGGL